MGALSDPSPPQAPVKGQTRGPMFGGGGGWKNAPPPPLNPIFSPSPSYRQSSGPERDALAWHCPTPLARGGTSATLQPPPPHTAMSTQIAQEPRTGLRFLSRLPIQCPQGPSRRTKSHRHPTCLEDNDRQPFSRGVRQHPGSTKGAAHRLSVDSPAEQFWVRTGETMHMPLLACSLHVYRCAWTGGPCESGLKVGGVRKTTSSDAPLPRSLAPLLTPPLPRSLAPQTWGSPRRESHKLDPGSPGDLGEVWFVFGGWGLEEGHYLHRLRRHRKLHLSIVAYQKGCMMQGRPSHVAQMTGCIVFPPGCLHRNLPPTPTLTPNPGLGDGTELVGNGSCAIRIAHVALSTMHIAGCAL